MAALPTLSGVNIEQCITTSRGKGVCCSAVTQLGAAQAAAGFQYTDCKGKVICAKCLIAPSQSTNPAKTGKPVFRFKRTSCGPSGCPALAGFTGPFTGQPFLVG